MRMLAIETAFEACSVALFDGAKLIARDHRVMARGHAEALVPMIAALPDKGRSNRILVSRGPGSFTGVRIGIAAARALGFAWQAKVLGYPTLALVAAQAQVGTDVTVCMNGGHGEWFVQDFAADGTPANVLRSLSPAAAVSAGARAIIAGNRADEFAAMLSGDRRVVDLLPDAGQTGLMPQALHTADLSPIYGRGADAKPMAGLPAG